MSEVVIFDFPVKSPRKELEISAFHDAGGTDDVFFEKYWSRYQELLVEKLGYLCDGNMESCGEQNCYKRGSGGQHTTDEAHAINRKKDRWLVEDEDGILWDVAVDASAEKREDECKCPCPYSDTCDALYRVPHEIRADAEAARLLAKNAFVTSIANLIIMIFTLIQLLKH